MTRKVTVTMPDGRKRTFAHAKALDDWIKGKVREQTRAIQGTTLAPAKGAPDGDATYNALGDGPGSATYKTQRKNRTPGTGGWSTISPRPLVGPATILRDVEKQATKRAKRERRRLRQQALTS